MGWESELDRQKVARWERDSGQITEDEYFKKTRPEAWLESEAHQSVMGYYQDKERIWQEYWHMSEGIIRQIVSRGRIETNQEHDEMLHWRDQLKSRDLEPGLMGEMDLILKACDPDKLTIL